jgi:heptosyltransferase-1
MRRMAGPRILFVKLSSLGDVIHHLPAVSDLARERPDAHLGWVAEEAYCELVALHPAVSETFPAHLRSLRSNPLRPAAWRSLAATRRALRAGQWDYVIDAQGLLKSALVASFARSNAFGLDRKSAREGMAARFYDVKIPVPRAMHAVERNRRLVAEVFGYAVAGPPRYGLAPPEAAPAWAPDSRYVVMLHAASRAAKRWPDERWIALGSLLAARGHVAVFPGGSPEERATAARLAARVPDAMAAPPMSLVEAAALIAHSQAVVGVDTGLTHLGAALGVPTFGIYCATDPRLTGLHGGDVTNLGGAKGAPTLEEVALAMGLSTPAP